VGGNRIDCGPEQGPLIAHLQAAMQADAPRTRSQAKRWELLSTAGVALLGAAAALLVSRWFALPAQALLMAGLVVHGLGMWGRRRAERQQSEYEPGWMTGLYWACWLMLVALGAVGLNP
jgi:hypothetical protein